MRNISNSKISNYGRNRRSFLNNPRYKSDGRVKTKLTFNQLVNETHNQFVEKWDHLWKLISQTSMSL
jgi:hypothetical protein